MDNKDRLQEYNQRHEALLAELLPQIVLQFPRHKKVPLLSKIAIYILTLQGMVAAVKMNDISK